MSRLRPHPHRGELIAAGAVPLAVAAFVIDLRMIQWSVGTRFIVVALIAVLLLTMGWLAELEEHAPRAYHSILLIAGLLPMALALVLLAEALGADRPPGSGGLFWTFAAEAAVAAAAARRANSGACTLIAALAVGLGLVAYAGVDREPGPAYIGVAVLLAFAVLTGGFAGNRGSLVGWPLFLLVIGAVGLGIGLRPRQALPPPPSTPAPPTPPPTLPLRPVDDGA